MRLVTFHTARGKPRAGVLTAKDTKIVDLAAAYRERHGGRAPALASVLAIIEGGANALDIAAHVVKGAQSKTPDAIVPRKAATLLAPIPVPPQMRDCLCFEKHLVQAFGAARKVRAQESASAASIPAR